MNDPDLFSWIPFIQFTKFVMPPSLLDHPQRHRCTRPLHLMTQFMPSLATKKGFQSAPSPLLNPPPSEPSLPPPPPPSPKTTSRDSPPLKPSNTSSPAWSSVSAPAPPPPSSSPRSAPSSPPAPSPTHLGVPTSKRTAEQAASLGIPLAALDDYPHLDLAIDGADEVDPNLDLVKGRGGALLREKMVEAASDKFVVVADETKLVSGLGGSGLAMPVEVVQFCWKYNLKRLQEMFKEEGCEAKLRVDGDGKPYVTDNSNYIVDLYFTTPIKDAKAAGEEISDLEGVVEHGLFLDMATAVIIAGKDGVTVKAK
ncbi:putative ribose-5-phosphate isomerase [Acorus calamus]|uniref:ribose-5-phosphate isomerase n=1 Tax=Acorus calamus TaxID=4465 RepID=A0AAV9D2F4_ACOCL|nr:putative ribose-5-phosphate isomerase [Acorus calamus]